MRARTHDSGCIILLSRRGWRWRAAVAQTPLLHAKTTPNRYFVEPRCDERPVDRTFGCAWAWFLGGGGCLFCLGMSHELMRSVGAAGTVQNRRDNPVTTPCAQYVTCERVGELRRIESMVAPVVAASLP